MLSGTTGDSSNDPIAEFCLYLERLGRSAITVMNYRSDLKGMVRWSEGRNKEKFDLLRFAQADVDEYRAFLIRRYKASTVNRKLATWKLYSKWALRTGLLESPVLTHVVNMRLTPRVRSAPQYLDPSDQAQLLRVVRVQGSVEDIAVITLLLNTGIRVSELCALRWSDVQMSDGTGDLLVYSSKKHLSRHVPLNNAARKALISLGYTSHFQTTGHIFGGKSGSMTRRRVVGIFNRYCKLAGLQRGDHLGPLTPVILRLTVRRNLLKAGVNPHIVGSWMDDSTLKSTNMYFRTFDDDIEQEAAIRAIEALSV